MARPERHRTLDLLPCYLRLAGLALEVLDFDGEPGRLDAWKREAEITRKYKGEALRLLRGDPAYRYGYLVPGLLGGADDPFLLDYLIRCRPGVDLVRRCAGRLKAVEVAREHEPFLQSLLNVGHDTELHDAAILQLVRLDRRRYLDEVKARPDDFSPEVLKLLLDPPGE